MVHAWFNGERYLAPSVEHAYQAEKALKLEDFLKVLKAKSPGQAKKIGRTVEICKDWEARKLAVMERLLREKFSNDHLNTMLLETFPNDLVEGNYWHDNFWGSCNCTSCGDKGLNHLGQLLMAIRDEF